MTPDEPLVLLLGILVGVLAVTRALRLVVDDDYPPMEKIRKLYLQRTSEEWNPLIECPWCAAPYVALPATAWFATLVAFPTWTVNIWIWWLVNGWAAVSWVAAFLTVRDIPPDQRS